MIVVFSYRNRRTTTGGKGGRETLEEELIDKQKRNHLDQALSYCFFLLTQTFLAQRHDNTTAQRQTRGMK
jgi:hypothetical protein